MSRNLNQCSFIGNLTKDPDMRYTPSGLAVTKFTLAVNGKEEVDCQFINIVAWRKLGEICGEYLKKGQKVFVQGQYKQSSWESEGTKHYKVEIILEQMEMLSGKKPGAETSGSEPPNKEEMYADVPF